MRDERLSADLGADDGAALALGERGNLIFARLHRQNERFCIMHRIGRETSMDSKLFLEVFQREEGMTGIKTLLIFPVTALHFAVVPWSIRMDQSVSNPQISGSFLKQGHAVTLAVGKMGTASLL